MANAKKVINANIILYGPPRAGKTSNIQFIHRKLKPSQRGQIMPLSQDGYPQVAYEFLPIELGELKGYDTNLYIYTSPDHDDGLETRLNLLNEAAGVVFIADSSPDRMDDNIESLTNLKEELRYWGIDYDNFPLVFQYNKRDLPNALPRDELALQLNPEGKESFEAIASAGQGVRDTFALISKMAVRRVRLKLVAEENDEELPESERRHPVEGERRLPPRRERPAVPSEVTLDVAPPPRYDDEEESEEGPGEADELEVDDLDRRNQPALSIGGGAEVAAADDTTDHGVRARAQAEVPAEIPEVAQASATPEPPVVGEANQTDEEAQTVPSEKGRRNQKRGSGRKKDQAATEVKPADATEEPEAASSDAPEAPAGNREDFLKTSFSFEEEPMMVATLEAAEADEADDAEEERQYHSLSGALGDGLSKITIPESPAIGAITFTGMADAEVNIQTYSEEEEDEDEPVIRLGARASEGEELQLEEEMELEDAPLDDGATVEELLPEGGTAVEDLVDQEEASTSAGAVPLVAPPQAVGGSLPPPSFDDSDMDDDEDRSIIASQEELEQVGMNAFGERIDAAALGGPPASVPTWTEDVEARSVTDDDEDPFIQSGRIDEALVDQLPPPGQPAGLSASSGGDVDLTTPVEQELTAPEASSAEAAGAEGQGAGELGLTTPTEEDDALPDMAIAPLEEEAEKESVFEMANEEVVFEAVVSEPIGSVPVREESGGDQSAQGRTDAPTADATPTGEAFSGNGREAEAQASARSEEAAVDGRPRPVITGWGDAIRVDAQTLVMPVTVTLPDSTQEVQLSVTLKVDLMLEALLAAGQPVGRA